MRKNFKYFLISFFFSSFFFFFLNFFEENLQDFFFWLELQKFPLKAQFSQEFLEKYSPLRNWKVKNLELEAEAAISLFVDKKNQEKVLFEKNAQKRLPLASLTKLMTALVALENYQISETIEISQKDILTKESKIYPGQKIKIEKLLHFLIVISENSAAQALANKIGFDLFVFLMNEKAKFLNLKNTFFANPTGLDPLKENEKINYSSAEDLAKLAKYITLKRPFIWQISTLKKIDSQENTNKLLGKVPAILGGKTGETKRAGKCFLLVIQAPNREGFIINVILNAKDHFKEMKKMITWIKHAYEW